MKFNNLSLFLLIVVLFGCFTFDEGDQDSIGERYYYRGDVGFLDVHLDYINDDDIGVGILANPINQIGYNTEYIIAIKDSKYFLIKMIDSGTHSDAEEEIMKFNSREKIDAAVAMLGLKNLNFTRTFTKPANTN